MRLEGEKPEVSSPLNRARGNAMAPLKERNLTDYRESVLGIASKTAALNGDRIQVRDLSAATKIYWMAQRTMEQYMITEVKQ